jgi:hypothetical protein
MPIKAGEEDFNGITCFSKSSLNMIKILHENIKLSKVCQIYLVGHSQMLEGADR